MLTHIKKWSYSKKLKEKRSHIKSPLVQPVNPGKKIGILFELEKLDDHSVVKTLKQQFAKEGRIVKTLSYIDQKIDVESLAQRTFSKKELKWDGVPKSHYVEEFMEWEFDLLICPIKVMRPCFQYIIKISPAKLKIGLNTDHAEDLYDLIIDFSDDKDLSDILAEILYQLKVVSH